MSQVARLLTIILVTSLLLTMMGVDTTGTKLLDALGVYDSSTQEWTTNEITLSTLFGDFFDTSTGAIATIAVAASLIVGAYFGGSPQGYLLVPAIISIAVFANDMVGLVNYLSDPMLKNIVGIIATIFGIYYIFSLIRFWYGND